MYKDETCRKLIGFVLAHFLHIRSTSLGYEAAKDISNIDLLAIHPNYRKVGIAGDAISEIGRVTAYDGVASISLFSSYKKTRSVRLSNLFPCTTPPCSI